MKIYYDIPDELEPDQDMSGFYEGIVNILPERLRDGMRYFFNRYPEMNRDLVKQQYEIRKLEMMWKLRSIEDKLKSEEGCIVLCNNGETEIKGYRQELEEDIRYLLSLK
jgi:hypothetical protein